MEREQEQAMVQAQSSGQLVMEGLENDPKGLMGVYKLMEGEVVNGRAVWQKQGGQWERLFLYYYSSMHGSNRWAVSGRKQMEAGSGFCIMRLITTALTPDQARPSDVWGIINAAVTSLVDAPAVRVRRQT
jgi:hypothetical protein